MIDGIEILNKTEIMTISDAGLLWTFILVFGGVICAALCAFLSNYHNTFIIGVIFGVVAFFSGFIVGDATEESKPTGRYQYECTIDESVSFKDVLENYEVVEQKGKLWILEDKEK